VGKERRRYSREFKLKALGRLETAGNVLELARELGVRRELLYKWRRLFAAGGEAGLRTTGRPRPVAGSPEAMAAEARIAALERKVGQQAIALDFFKDALRRIEASRRPSDGPGATASSPGSER
jgi:transposase-like protein